MGNVVLDSVVEHVLILVMDQQKFVFQIFVLVMLQMNVMEENVVLDSVVEHVQIPVLWVLKFVPLILAYLAILTALHALEQLHHVTLVLVHYLNLMVMFVKSVEEGTMIMEQMLVLPVIKQIVHHSLFQMPLESGLFIKKAV